MLIVFFRFEIFELPPLVLFFGHDFCSLSLSQTFIAQWLAHSVFHRQPITNKLLSGVDFTFHLGSLPGALSYTLVF